MRIINSFRGNYYNKDDSSTGITMYFFDEDCTIPYNEIMIDYFKGFLNCVYTIQNGHQTGVEILYYEESSAVERLSYMLHGNIYGISVEFFESGEISLISMVIGNAYMDVISYNENGTLKEKEFIDHLKTNAFVGFAINDKVLLEYRRKYNLEKIADKIKAMKSDEGYDINSIAMFIKNIENTNISSIQKSNKHSFPEFPKLEQVIPLAFHEMTNQFITDYKELSERELWEKYDLRRVWHNADDYVIASKQHGSLGKVLICVLELFDYILQTDKKETLIHFNPKNFWDEEPVKLVQFDLENDQNYYAYIPQSTDLKSIFDVKIYEMDIHEQGEPKIEMW